jgi:type II secretory pathway component GspD/PulD (secretin)
LILSFSGLIFLASGYTPVSGEDMMEAKDEKISMDFENVSLKNILKIFSKQTGINFIASSIIENKMVTIYFKDVSFEEALNSILASSKLAYQKRGEKTYLIIDAPKREMGLVTRIFKLNYLQVYDITDAEGTSSQGAPVASGGSSGGGGGGAGGAGGGKQSSGMEGISTAMVENVTKAAEGAISGSGGGGGKSGGEGIIKILQSLMSSSGQILTDRRSNSLIITDVADVFEAIEKVIKDLDVAPIQVMIQAEIIETTTDALKRIGVEYGSDTKTLGFTYADQSTSLGYPYTENFIKNTFGTNLMDSGTFTYGTLTQDEVAVVIKLLMTDNNTKYLSKPRIMTINNEPAEVNTSAKTAVGVTQTTVNNAGGNVLSQAERYDTGVTLKVVPNVNENGDIFMYIEPSISRAQTSSFSADYMDPLKRSSTSTVMIKEGDSVVIAGLIQTNKIEMKRKVPFLGDIPLLGQAFRSDYNKVEDTELIIFVTPYIVKKGEDRYVTPRGASLRDEVMEKTLMEYRNKKKRTAKEKDHVGPKAEKTGGNTT